LESVTRLTVVPLRTGPSQGNDKNLGRSPIAVWIPNEARINAYAVGSCSQLLTIARDTCRLYGEREP
jgi:hypothetical protein